MVYLSEKHSIILYFCISKIK